MAEIVWHRRETRRQTENTNFGLNDGKAPACSPYIYLPQAVGNQAGLTPVLHESSCWGFFNVRRSVAIVGSRGSLSERTIAPSSADRWPCRGGCGT
jgi:hypothetical protein